MRKDWKNRPYIFSGDDTFYEFDGNVEVYKTWSDITVASPNRILEIRNTYDFEVQQQIFHFLWLLQTSNNGLVHYSDKKQKERVEKAIQKGIGKYNKVNRYKVGMITLVDDIYMMGETQEYFLPKAQITLIEQLTKDAIVLIDKEYRHHNLDKIDLSKASEVKIVDKYDMPQCLKRKMNDYRPIYILGGRDLFRCAYQYVTDLYITYTDVIHQPTLESHFFTKINLNLFNMESTHSIRTEHGLLQPTHFTLKNGMQPRWKENSFDYRYN